MVIRIYIVLADMLMETDYELCHRVYIHTLSLNPADLSLWCLDYYLVACPS